MNSRLQTAGRISLVALILAASVALISWQQDKQPEVKQKQNTYSDTIPSKEKKVRDLDEALEQLDHLDLQGHIDLAMASAAQAMKHFDAEKLHLEVQKALENVDMNKIQVDVEKALKEIDFEKIQREVNTSLAKVDWDEIKADMEEAKKEIAEAKKINFEEINRELEKAKEEIKKIKPALEKELAKAQVEIEKAKEEVREYKNFVDGLDKDRLLDKKEDYTILHKDGKLIINGKEASSETYNKYKTFLDKHKKLNIEKTGNSFSMDDDDND